MLINGYKKLNLLFRNINNSSEVWLVEKGGTKFALKSIKTNPITKIGQSFIACIKTSYSENLPKLGHNTNIVKVYETFWERDIFYIVMEYLDKYIPLTKILKNPKFNISGILQDVICIEANLFKRRINYEINEPVF